MTLLSATLGLALADNAQAAFNLTGTPPAGTQVSTAAAPDKVSGFGDRVPLFMATTELVPSSLLVEYRPGVDPQSPVSWRGEDKPWRDVFTTALTSAGMTFHVDGQHVIIEAATHQVQTASLTASAAPTPLKPGSAASLPPIQEKVISPTRLPQAVPAQDLIAGDTWQTTPKLKLRDQIAKWIEQTGGQYQLAPPAADDPAEPWMVTIGDTVHGDFLTALTWLRDGFAAAPRPDIEVTHNNVVIIHRLGAAY